MEIGVSISGEEIELELEGRSLLIAQASAPGGRRRTDTRMEITHGAFRRELPADGG
jgi:hypothetical protein